MPDFATPAEIGDILSSAHYWEQLVVLNELLDPFLYSVAYLEGDSTPLSAIMGCFLYISNHIQTVTTSQISGVSRASLMDKLKYQLNRIGHSALALAFMIDPFLDHPIQYHIDSTYSIVKTFDYG